MARGRAAETEESRRPPNAASKIVVAGDVCIDWLAFSVPAVDPDGKDGRMPPNFRLYRGTHMVARPGGALLLSRLVAEATGIDVATHDLRDLEVIPPEDVIHSIIEVESFPYSTDKKDEKNLVYRVLRYGGFAGPATGAPPLLPVTNDDADAELVVLDDAGNGFRDVSRAWPAAVRTGGKHPLVIFKMSRPLSHGKLWEKVRKTHADRLVVVVHADHLRAEGLKISRRLSWERTATEFLWQIASNPRHLALAGCENLVVLFGIEGAIHYTRSAGRIESRLYYDRTVAEDGVREECPGAMAGFSSAFVAALAARVAGEGLDGVGEGIRDGLRSSRRLFLRGFGRSPVHLDYPARELFGAEDEGDPRIADVVLPNPTDARQPDPGFWSILEELGEARLEEVAYDIVRDGEAAALSTVPLGRFGALATVDRAEIESLRSIRNLMEEYLEITSPPRPLAIAVFGPPGSGKSFGVTEVAKSIARQNVQKLEFNVAQFTSTADLARAFHQVRDVTLGGEIPLVFFDEFDSDFNGKLGWLKYFLMPMQDGKFRDAEFLHPIGKAILVFAGGTSVTYGEFSREKSRDKRAKQAFIDAKGPDFASRLRGYVNIMGPNCRGEHDQFFVIRRAMLLRSQLGRKAKHLFDGKRRVQIDDGVLRAFIKVPAYKHGARSMEAIIDMSMLARRRSFEQACLPPPEQLELHVDAETFSQLVVRDVLFGAAREKLARAIHEKFRRDQQGRKAADDPALLPWEHLPADLRESNLRQADDIPRKLRRIRCGFSPVVDRDPVKITFTKEEIAILAEMEHDRWVAERHLAGWSLGKGRDIDKRTSPWLVPWKDVPTEVREYDYETVSGMPEFMADAGFEIYRLE